MILWFFVNSLRVDKTLLLVAANSVYKFVLTILKKYYTQCEIIKDDPVVTYKETITTESSGPPMNKTQNKHNRVHSTSAYAKEGFPILIKTVISPTTQPIIPIFITSKLKKL
jgi:hypothetical protein